MKKTKSIAGCIGITVLLWITSRFIPAFLSALDPDSALLKIFSFVIMLPLGWWIAKFVSNSHHSTCIRTNLYIFAVIEIPGIFTAITYLMQNLTFYTERYSVDANGIAYSDYLAIFGSLLLFEIAYIFLCFYLAKKTVSTRVDASMPEKEDASMEILEKKRKLKEEIAKMEAALKAHDAAYKENKQILSEAYTDEQLLLLVANGEFPAEHVKEYLDLRRNLTMFVDSAAQIRKMHIGMIDDLKRQLSQFEPIQPAKQKSSSTSDTILGVLLMIIVILLIAIFIVLSALYLPSSQTSVETMANTETIEPVTRPSNGQIVVYPRGRRAASLTVFPAVDKDYFFVLNPISDASNKISFYAHAGDKVEILVCCDEYEIYCASGTTWYGTDLLFGPDTIYQKFNRTFRFSEAMWGYSNWVLRVNPSTKNAPELVEIQPEEFPR